jgi:hypothetical protein
MREWARETHGPWLELLRHFLLRFFDSELITSPEHTRSTLVWTFALALPWFPVVLSPLKDKYAYFASLAIPGPFRQAVRGDELWLLTLLMGLVGLLTAVKWQALFPGLRDYRALGSLPLRARQIFAAKLLALFLVATAAVITLCVTPILGMPMLTGGPWSINQSLGARMAAFGTALGGGCYFSFFALLALQGTLLNLLPARTFGRVTGSLQGLLVAAMLMAIVLSFSIHPGTAAMAVGSAAARWLPPVWFMGLCQSLMGDRDPVMAVLARRAELALPIAAGIALLSYAVSYRRHRELMVEGMAGSSRDRKWTSVALGWLIPEPRQQGVVVFLCKTLARSSQHRMILMGYCGFGLAVVATGLLGIGELYTSTRLVAARFVYAHVILLVFLLLGLRHLFSIPAELRANWTFQMTEAEGRYEWLEAMDRFVLALGATVVLALPFPFEVKLIGWRAVGEAMLFIAVGLLCYEWLFADWAKLPFTCSHLPGKTPLWITFLYLLGLLTALPFVNGVLLMSLFSGAGFTIVLVLSVAAWMRIHAARRVAWGALRLTYDERPDPAIHGLNLLG